LFPTRVPAALPCGLKPACAASSRCAAVIMRRGRGRGPNRRVGACQAGKAGGSSNYRAAAAARDAVLQHSTGESAGGNEADALASSDGANVSPVAGA
jgi:hypothetical protein